MIKFTFVTVTYNAQDVIERTTRSILSQTYPHIEHIIIDGASKDGTFNKAQAYQAQNALARNGHEVVLKSEPDHGIYDAMNKGLAMATGQYVCFLNAGDSLPFPDTVATIVASAGLEDSVLAHTPLPAVLYGDTDIVDGNGSYLFRRRLSPPDVLTWRSFMQGMVVCHQAFYARTDIARTLPYNLSYKYSADVDWCIRVMKEAEKRNLALKNVHATIVNYMQQGATTRHHKASLKERFHIMAHYYGLPATIGLHLWFTLRGIVMPRRMK